MRSHSSPDETYWLLDDEQKQKDSGPETTALAAAASNAPELRRNLSTDMEQFERQYEKYNAWYADMVQIATVSAKEKLTLSDKDKSKRIGKAKQKYKDFQNESNELATMFRLKFNLYRDLANVYKGNQCHVHHLHEESIIKSLFVKATYDVLRDRIKSGCTDPLVLLNFGIISFHMGSYGRAEGCLKLAWLFAGNSTLLKNEIERLYEIMRVVLRGALNANDLRINELLQPGNRAPSLIYNIHDEIKKEKVNADSVIYQILAKYPRLVRAEIIRKITEMQAEAHAALQAQQGQQSVIPNSVFSASAPQPQGAPEQRPHSIISHGRYLGSSEPDVSVPEQRPHSKIMQA